MCPQSKKTVTGGRSLSALYNKNVQGQSLRQSSLITSSPPVQVVLPTLVSLNLAQAQLFGPRPALARNNNQIVEQVLAELSPTIAQVNIFVHYRSHSNFTWLRLSPRLLGV